jgi:methionine synthase / methylenetetrahydrofolate reductase(NADPH)
MSLLEAIETHPLCGDGTVGTLLKDHGGPENECAEALCISRPDLVREIHAEYVKAGADIIRTNTFAANGVQLERHGLSHHVNEINWQATQLARQAAKGAFVAGNVGPLGITSEHQDVDPEECFRTQIGALLEGGVDLIFFEAFLDVDELLVALHVKQSLHHCPAICSLTTGEDGLLPGNVSLEVALEKMARHDAEVFGLNCLSGAEVALRLVEKLVPSELALAVYPNMRRPGYFHDGYGYDLSAEAFARLGVALAERGVRIIGGGCGAMPAHIAALSKALIGRR